LRDFFQHHDLELEEEVMERRNFLGLTLALTVGAAALTLAAAAQAAPVPPIPAQQNIQPALGGAAEPAVLSQEEIDRIRPVEMRWGHHRHWGWHRHHWRRHWGWRHRHWGWRHRHWHHRHWHRW
jgi:hypothetical protein